jgi:hypothetical protein
MLAETQVVSGMFGPLQTRLSVVARFAGIDPHRRQLFAPLSEDDPEGQVEQALAPVAEENVPPGHSEQTAAPDAEE